MYRSYYTARDMHTTPALKGHGYDTAALTGCGYDTAALDGCGYDTAALYGCGKRRTAKARTRAQRGGKFGDALVKNAASALMRAKKIWEGGNIFQDFTNARKPQWGKATAILANAIKKKQRGGGLGDLINFAIEGNLNVIRDWAAESKAQKAELARLEALKKARGGGEVWDKIKKVFIAPGGPILGLIRLGVQEARQKKIDKLKQELGEA